MRVHLQSALQVGRAAQHRMGASTSVDLRPEEIADIQELTGCTYAQAGRPHLFTHGPLLHRPLGWVTLPGAFYCDRRAVTARRSDTQ
jgi:hypothetical protein